MASSCYPRDKPQSLVHIMVGQFVEFQDEGTGQITDETEDAIYIISNFFTGWMLKAEYFELLGIAD